MTIFAILAGIGALLAALMFVPIFKPRGRLTKIRAGYRITPEIEKARKDAQNRLTKGEDERG